MRREPLDAMVWLIVGIVVGAFAEFEALHQVARSGEPGSSSGNGRSRRFCLRRAGNLLAP
jgi:hypothetical protein